MLRGSFPWNPVKELKVGEDFAVCTDVDHAWNPVKELKVAGTIAVLFLLGRTVESGEGIER